MGQARAGAPGASGKSRSAMSQVHVQHGAAKHALGGGEVVARYGGRSVPLADHAKPAGVRWGAMNAHRNGAR